MSTKHMLLSDFAEYQIIFQNAKSTVYRVRMKGGKVSAIKIPAQAAPTQHHLDLFSTEHRILSKLPITGVRKILAISELEGRPALVMEYVDGNNLKEALERESFTVAHKLQMAIQLTGILAEIHGHQVIHKDLSLRNVIVDLSTQKVTLIDFEFATQLNLKTHHLGNPERIDGTLAYISPEQTGRMNRLVDYRSDLYALGVCLFELFTGQLPFLQEDPMELVFSHLAKHPPVPTQLNPKIPMVLSDLILKLLEKNAEDRYQSARGLQIDLQHCLQFWDRDGNIPYFELGRQDYSEKFQIPQKLYGRTHELEALHKAYQSISKGNFQLMLVAGYSGVGKTALVYEVHKPLTEHRGFFIEGKFDQYQRDIPHYAWIQAFNQFVDLLLTENPVKLELWKQRLLEALGTEGRILTDFVPGFEKIIGPQPKVVGLEAAENTLRFKRIMKATVAAIAQEEHPLFLFIDDWQWADTASLELLSSLATDPANSYFMITGAYRNNEVAPDHPFQMLIESLENAAIPMDHLVLENLSPDSIVELLSDTLRRTPEDCRPLMQTLHQKTRGNAFFLRQLLRSLYEKQVLTFDNRFRNRGWFWDTAVIEQMQITDNVVHLMVEKVEKLPNNTKKVLMLASCIGTLFKKDLLAIVYQDTEEAVLEHLHPAMLEGLVIPSGSYYTFAHDRIQQAVYSLIPETEKQQVHYQIGKLMWQNSTQRTDQLFDIVNQLIVGKIHIQHRDEEVEVASLCLEAGLKAKQSSANETAIRYFQYGIALLSNNGWAEQYPMRRDLNFHCCTCAINLKQFKNAHSLIEDGLTNAQTVLDKVKLLERKATCYNWEMEFNKQEEASLQGLALCGFHIPTDESKIRLAISQTKKKVDQLLRSSQPDALYRLPSVSSELDEIKMKMLTVQAMGYKINGKSLHFAFTITTALLGIFEQGHTSASANILSLYCSLLADEDRYSESFQLAEVAARMVEENHHLYLVLHTITRAALWGYPYGRHLKDAIPVYELGLRLAPQQDLSLLMTTAIKMDMFFHRLAMGAPLQKELKAAEEIIEGGRSGFYMFHDIGILEQQFILLLMGKKTTISMYEESSDFSTIMMPDNSFFRGFHSHNLLQFYCWFPDRPAPAEYLVKAKHHHHSMSSNIKWGNFDFYALLFTVLRYPERVVEQQTRYWPDIVDFRRKLRLRAEACPDNFLHQHLLIEAEFRRLEPQEWEALDYYYRSIDTAHKYQFTHIEALANERCAYFFMERSRTDSAIGHLQKARKLYEQWGARAKIRQLEKRFPVLGALNIGNKASTSGSSSARDLDYLSLLKASQTLSSEIVLSNLLDKMLPIVLESAGAQEGAIIEYRHEHPILRARVDVAGKVHLMEDAAILTEDALPLSLINYVWRTKKVVVLPNDDGDEKFTRDPYMRAQQPKSVLCFPLLRNQDLSAIFYFENNLATGAFTEERLEILRSLSAQVSISLENAKLYQEIEDSLNRQVELTEAYSRFVPREFLKHLGHNSVLDVQLGDQVQGEMSVLFADIRGYTTLSERMTPSENFNFINAYLRRVGPIISANDGFIGQYSGDGFMAIFLHGAESAVKAALDIQKSVSVYNDRRSRKGRSPIKVGIGIHTGSLMMGIIGHEERMDPTVISDTVNAASRLEGLTKYFDTSIIISGASFEQIEKHHQRATRFLGQVTVKGRQQVMPIFEVFDPESDAVARKKAKTKADFEKGLRLYFNRDFVDATLQLKGVVDAFPEDPLAQRYLLKAARYLAEGVPVDWTGVEQFDDK